MATHILVTAANLTVVTFNRSPTVLLPADLATIAAGIKDDGQPALLANQGVAASAITRQTIYGAFTREGWLTFPGRGGRIQVLPGDVVGFTSRGWPIHVSGDEIANGTSFTYT